MYNLGLLKHPGTYSMIWNQLTTCQVFYPSMENNESVQGGRLTAIACHMRSYAAIVRVLLHAIGYTEAM